MFTVCGGISLIRKCQPPKEHPRTAGIGQLCGPSGWRFEDLVPSTPHQRPCWMMVVMALPGANW